MSSVDGAHNEETVHKVFGKPHQFADVGKLAKDLLYKGFTSGHMLMVSCLAPGGVVLSTTATMLGGSVVGLMSTSWKSGGVVSELSGGTFNQIQASTTYNDLSPGLKVSVTTVLPGAANLGKTQIQYQMNNAALDATFLGLKSNPTVQLSANLGSERLSLGCSVLYNTETNEPTASSVGLGYLTPETSGALLYDPIKDNALDAYFTQTLSPRTSVGAHVKYLIEKQETSATFGGKYLLDMQSSIKAKLDNQGVMGVLLEHQPHPLVSVGLYADVDTRNLQTRTPNLGFSVSLLASVV